MTAVLDIDNLHLTIPDLYSFDPTNENWNFHPGANEYFINRWGQMHNDKIRATGFVFLNEVLSSLGLVMTQAGQVMGWAWDKEASDYIEISMTYDPSGAILLQILPERYILDRLVN